MDNAKVDRFVFSDSITLVSAPAGAQYTGDGVFFTSALGSSIYLEGEPAALVRLRDRLNEKLQCV